MDSTSIELNKIAAEVEQVDSNKIAPDFEARKEKGIFQTGDRVICANPVQGIYKGRCYIVDENIDPSAGVISVTELDGAPVGAFRSSRFCMDWNSF